MYRLEKSFRFEASHRLPSHDGKCQRLHGHSFGLMVVVEGDDGSLTPPGHGPKAGMLMDYGDLSALVKPLLEECLDHHHLNDTTGLTDPTSENLAHWVYWRLKPVCRLLAEVTVEETCTSRCTYRPDPTPITDQLREPDNG